MQGKDAICTFVAKANKVSKHKAYVTWDISMDTSEWANVPYNTVVVVHGKAPGHNCERGLHFLPALSYSKFEIKKVKSFLSRKS